MSISQTNLAAFKQYTSTKKLPIIYLKDKCVHVAARPSSICVVCKTVQVYVTLLYM